MLGTAEDVQSRRTDAPAITLSPPQLDVALCVMLQVQYTHTYAHIRQAGDMCKALQLPAPGQPARSDTGQDVIAVV